MLDVGMGYVSLDPYTGNVRGSIVWERLQRGGLGRTGNFKIWHLPTLLSAASGLELRVQRHVAARGARVVPTA